MCLYQSGRQPGVPNRTVQARQLWTAQHYGRTDANKFEFGHRLNGGSVSGILSKPPTPRTRGHIKRAPLRLQSPLEREGCWAGRLDVTDIPINSFKFTSRATDKIYRFIDHGSHVQYAQTPQILGVARTWTGMLFEPQNRNGYTTRWRRTNGKHDLMCLFRGLTSRVVETDAYVNAEAIPSHVRLDYQPMGLATMSCFTNRWHDIGVDSFTRVRGG